MVFTVGLLAACGGSTVTTVTETDTQIVTDERTITEVLPVTVEVTKTVTTTVTQQPSTTASDAPPPQADPGIVRILSESDYDDVFVFTDARVTTIDGAPGVYAMVAYSGVDWCIPGRTTIEAYFYEDYKLFDEGSWTGDVPNDGTPVVMEIAAENTWEEFVPQGAELFVRHSECE